MEEWKQVVGYEDMYEVSNLGRIRSIPRKHSWRGLIFKPVKAKGDYYIISLHKNLKQKNHRLQRLVMDAFKPIDKFMDVNHINGDKSDNRLSNLEWCTKKENAQHSRRLGLQYVPKGNELPHAKSNPNQVREIRKVYKMNKYSLQQIADKVGSTKGIVFNIVHNNTWCHVI